MLRDNRVVLGLAALIVLVPLLLPSLKDAEFGGADGQAEGVISEISPGYEPWFAPLWEPPSGEIESLLFALQAALGAGLIGYAAGYLRGRRTQVPQAKGKTGADARS